MRETATRGDFLYPLCPQAALPTQGIPGQKSNSETLAGGEYIFAGSVSQIVLVLNRHDWCDGARHLELGNRNIRDAYMANFAQALQISQRSNRLCEWYIGVRRMELVQIDAIQPQALQTAFNRPPQMVGATVRDPGSGGLVSPSRLSWQ